MSVLLQEGGDRGAPALALARVRAPSDTTNGTSASKGTSHSKGQRSSSSTYHRQRRHSDFCEYGPSIVRPLVASNRTRSHRLPPREDFLTEMQAHRTDRGGRNAQPGSGKDQRLEKQPDPEQALSVSRFLSAHSVFPSSLTCLTLSFSRSLSSCTRRGGAGAQPA